MTNDDDSEEIKNAFARRYSKDLRYEYFLWQLRSLLIRHVRHLSSFVRISFNNTFLYIYNYVESSRALFHCTVEVLFSTMLFCNVRKKHLTTLWQLLLRSLSFALQNCLQNWLSNNFRYTPKAILSIYNKYNVSKRNLISNVLATNIDS